MLKLQQEGFMSRALGVMGRVIGVELKEVEEGGTEGQAL